MAKKKYTCEDKNFKFFTAPVRRIVSLFDKKSYPKETWDEAKEMLQIMADFCVVVTPIHFKTLLERTTRLRMEQYAHDIIYKKL